MLTLHDYYRSTACYRVRIALNFKNLNYQAIPVDLIKNGGGQNAPEFKRVNPQGLVPALQDSEHSISLSQSLAILEYLEEQYPTPALLPKTITLRAQARRIACAIACDIHPLNNLRVLQYITNTLKQSEEAKREWYHHWLKAGFDAIQSILQAENLSGDFCIGNQVSVADICLIPQLYNARRFEFPLHEYSLLTDIEARCLALPAFEKATPENNMAT